MQYVIPQEDTALEAVEGIGQELDFFDDWTQRYQFLIDLGRKLPEFPPQEQNDANKVDGCQSQVWIKPYEVDGKIFFAGASDAVIVKGLIALVLRIYSGRTAQEIRDLDTKFLTDLGLLSALSPTRGNGLSYMVERIRAVAA